jgi:hypothetical protein
MCDLYTTKHSLLIIILSTHCIIAVLVGLLFSSRISISTFRRAVPLRLQGFISELISASVSRMTDTKKIYLFFRAAILRLGTFVWTNDSQMSSQPRLQDTPPMMGSAMGTVWLNLHELKQGWVSQHGTNHPSRATVASSSPHSPAPHPDGQSTRGTVDFWSLGPSHISWSTLWRDLVPAQHLSLFTPAILIPRGFILVQLDKSF